MQDTERERFITAAVERTVCPVRANPRQQAAARMLISRGWMAIGDGRIEEIARPRRPANGGRLFGEIQRDEVAA